MVRFPKMILFKKESVPWNAQQCWRLLLSVECSKYKDRWSSSVSLEMNLILFRGHELLMEGCGKFSLFSIIQCQHFFLASFPPFLHQISLFPQFCSKFSLFSIIHRPVLLAKQTNAAEKQESCYWKKGGVLFPA